MLSNNYISINNNFSYKIEIKNKYITKLLKLYI